MNAKQPQSETDKTVAKLRQQITLLEQRVRQGEKSIRSVLAVAGLKDLMPAEELRVHVGTNTSSMNFYSQGISSAAKTIEVFGRKPDGPMLDWGCGSGRTFNWLRMLPGWNKHYNGCDVDSDAIAWLLSQGVKKAKVCDAQPPLPFDQDTFSGLFCYSVLTHIHADQHEAWYAEIARVLRPGGRAFLTIQGDTVIASRRDWDQGMLDHYNHHGWAHITIEGHYKDAALVSMAWARERLAPYFSDIVAIPKGYNNMDAFIATK
ncbi:MAG: class I SAM-dependent methyltransferase [Alphaproteobacteria bacterium]|nr:class I SAM-dependent methyltransferase [Alphaproteobacteria bacterium]